jgi:hypothetical protein
MSNEDWLLLVISLVPFLVLPLNTTIQPKILPQQKM